MANSLNSISCQAQRKIYKNVSGVVIFQSMQFLSKMTDFNWLSLQQRCLFSVKPKLYSQVSIVAMDLWFCFGRGDEFAEYLEIISPCEF